MSTPDTSAPGAPSRPALATTKPAGNLPLGIVAGLAAAIVGAAGLAPYWFEVEPTLYVSDDGDVSFRLEATYDLLLTQRLILQPRFELDAAASSTPEFGIGAGINDIQLGLRLRYEIRREVAPYVGVSWTRKLGNTADFARDEGEDVDSLGAVVGLRFWF